MARESGRGRQRTIKSVDVDPHEALTDIWRRGALKLAEQGRLMWLLGEGLGAALAGRGQGGPAPSEDALVAQITKWIQHPPAGPLGLTADARPAVPRARLRSKRADEPADPRPAFTLDGRSLAATRCPVLWIGSGEVGSGLWGSMVLGVGTDGFRRVLGLGAGSVRERAVSEELVGDLVVRGLDVEKGVLVVTEGSRALDRALEQAWNGRVQIAHCRARLRQEVLRHISPSSHAAIQSQLEAAWALAPDLASALLCELEEKLATDFPGAAERLSRSREASLVGARLGVPLPLRERLESAGTLRMAFRKSLRWAPPGAGKQALAVGVPAWLQRTRRLIGWRSLELLAVTLQTLHKGPENDAAPQS